MNSKDSKWYVHSVVAGGWLVDAPGVFEKLYLHEPVLDGTDWDEYYCTVHSKQMNRRRDG
jgi:hypothetical protein